MITEKLPQRVTELFIRGRKLNISVIFITQSYFSVPKDIRLNCSHYFLMGIPNKKELQQISYNHLAELDFKDFKSIYNRCTEKKHDFLALDMTLHSGDPLKYRKNLMPEDLTKSYNVQNETPRRRNQG